MVQKGDFLVSINFQPLFETKSFNPYKIITMKKLSIIVFLALSAVCLAQEKNRETENLIIDGAKLPKADKYDVKKVRDIVSEYDESTRVCNFLKVEKSNGKVTATPDRFGCFTWIFSKKGKVVAIKGIQGRRDKAYQAYSSNGKLDVGITCDCFLFN